MYIAELCCIDLTNEENNVEVSKEYWSQCHQKYSETEQLLMIIAGLLGSEKSFVIDVLRGLLKENCIVTAFSGIAAFNKKNLIKFVLKNSF